MDFREGGSMDKAQLLLGISTFFLGLRHGIDWDHIAAITDITSTQDNPKDGLVLGTIYAIGHGTIVFIFGLLAVMVDVVLPDWVDEFMEPFIGITLLGLGVYVIYSMAKHKEEFRMKSRAMLLLEAVKRGYDLLLEKVFHKKRIRQNEKKTYTVTSAYIIGVIHGIGAETPTQVLLFLSAAGVAGHFEGALLVLTFIVGMLISNSFITVTSTYGFLKVRKNPMAFLVVGALTAFFSIAVGLFFLLGQGGALPAIFGS